jgi:glycerol-3-phosphate dehydrogenase
MSTGGTAARAVALERLGRDRLDLLVIGGGILGSRVALDAARAGLRVALLDRGDFASATSSASSKLVHGGFRYLSLGNFGLVREAQSERRVLIRHVAPHLIWPMPLVLAIDRDSPHGAPAIALGLAIYTGLCGFREPAGRMVRPASATRLVPPLRAGRLDGCAVLEEAQTDDSRLTLATVAAAERAGAIVLNYATVVALERGRGRVTEAFVAGLPGEGLVAVRPRAVVNATGPWLDHVRRLEDPAAGTSIRLSKGVHAMLPLVEPWRAGVALLLPDKRNIYAVPCDGGLMLGATDTLYEGDPGSVEPEPGDVALLLGEAARVLPGELLRPEDVRYSFAGLRVLPPGEGDTQRARRERVLSIGSGGMVSIGGGKLTTHRAISLDVLRLLPAEVRPRRLPAAAEPLVPDRNGVLPRGLAPETVAHLVRLYGPDAAAVAAAAGPGGLEPVHPKAPDLWAQVDHAVEREWALTVEDVTRRRTSLALRGLDGPELRERVSARMRALGAPAPAAAGVRGQRDGETPARPPGVPAGESGV